MQSTMTESGWLTSDRSIPMLLHVRDMVSKRKVILFNIACCRRIWSLLDSEDQEAVLQAEAGVDDPDAIRELEERIDPERLAVLEICGLGSRNYPVSEEQRRLLTERTTVRIRLVGSILGYGIGSLAYETERLAASNFPEEQRPIIKAAEEKAQAEVVREIFGNPFQPVKLDPAWQTSNTLKLAQMIYDDRRFDVMPILADALEDAGCHHPVLLSHCRDVNDHVRGCWVIDLLLGKSY